MSSKSSEAKTRVLSSARANPTCVMVVPLSLIRWFRLVRDHVDFFAVNQSASRSLGDGGTAVTHPSQSLQ